MCNVQMQPTLPDLLQLHITSWFVVESFAFKGIVYPKLLTLLPFKTHMQAFNEVSHYFLITLFQQG